MMVYNQALGQPSAALHRPGYRLRWCWFCCRPRSRWTFDSALPTRKHSEPRLLDRSAELIELMRGKSTSEIAGLMDISDDLAALNAQRYADFSLPFSMRNARAAVLAFAGDVYQGPGGARTVGHP